MKKLDVIVPPPKPEDSDDRSLNRSVVTGLSLVFVSIIVFLAGVFIPASTIVRAGQIIDNTERTLQQIYARVPEEIRLLGELFREGIQECYSTPYYAAKGFSYVTTITARSLYTQRNQFVSAAHATASASRYATRLYAAIPGDIVREQIRTFAHQRDRLVAFTSTFYKQRSSAIPESETQRFRPIELSASSYEPSSGGLQHGYSGAPMVAGNGEPSTGEVLGTSTEADSALAAKISTILGQLLSEREFKGPKGDKGDPGATTIGTGLVQNSNGNASAVVGGVPIVTYVPPVSQNGFGGTSLAGFGQLSATAITTQAFTVTGLTTLAAVTSSNLVVSGDASVSGSLSAATSTLSSLVVQGPVELDGSTTIANLTVTGLNPGLTQGSVAFQGLSGLSVPTPKLWAAAL